MGTQTFRRVLLILCMIGILAITVKLAIGADVILNWDANSPAPDGYRIYQRVNGADYNYERWVCDTKETSCTVTDLSPGVQYYFVARAYVAQEQSGDSNEVNFLPAIAPPQNLRVTVEISVLINQDGTANIAEVKTIY